MIVDDMPPVLDAVAGLAVRRALGGQRVGIGVAGHAGGVVVTEAARGGSPRRLVAGAAGHGAMRALERVAGRRLHVPRDREAGGRESRHGVAAFAGLRAGSDLTAMDIILAVHATRVGQGRQRLARSVAAFAGQARVAAA